jgi:DNA-binding CsgD family transcriptional regulator
MGGAQRVRNRCRDRLEALCDADLDADEARRAAIGELRRAVGFDRWCWPLTDPDSALSTSGIAEVDFWPTLARMVALEQHGDVTAKPRLVAGPRASVALSSATGGDLARSRRWRECLSPYGIGDQLMTACRDRHGCWGSVELMRDTGDRAFGEDDARLLDELAPVLGGLLRRSLARARPDDAGDARDRPPGTLIVDAELQPAGWTPPLWDWLGELPSAGLFNEARMLPAAVYEIVARALAPADAAPGVANRVRIRARTGRWTVMEGARLEGGDTGRVAVTVRAATAEEVFDLLCKAHGLTRREREVSGLLLAGLATKQLAPALAISPHTVQDHLKAIFAKTGAGSRRELISHLAGHAAVAPGGERQGSFRDRP